MSSTSITINGLSFNEMPYMCGICPSYIYYNDKKGFCVLFMKQKMRYNNIPARCRKLFEKAFNIGGDLVIVIKE